MVVNYTLKGPIDLVAQDDVAAALQKAQAGGHQFQLELDTPGGFTSCYTSMKNSKFNTKVSRRAESVGALLFMCGQKRSISRNAKLMFHKARLIVGGQSLTHNIIKLFREGRLSQITEDQALVLSNIFTLDLIKASVIIDDCDRAIKADMVERLGQEVADKLYQNHNVTINGEQAVLMGVATELHKAPTAQGV